MKNNVRLLTLLGLFSASSLWAMMPIDTTEAFTVAPGCEYMAIRWLRQNDDSTSGINSFILRVDATNPNVSFQQRLGKETLMGRERLTKMAKRINQPLGTNPVCIAAVNGDFFWMENEDRENGLPRGFTVQDNEFVVTTDEDRRLGGITEDKLGLVGSHGIWTGAVSFNNTIIPLARINYCRKENELVLFNHYNDHSTNTDANGTEVLLELLPGQKWHCNCTVTARVIKVEKNIGSMVIPEDQVVLSGSGEKAEALNRLQEEDIVMITSAFSVDGVPTNFNQCIGSDQYAQILKDGVVETQDFWPGDHPRNSFGYTQSRDTFFFVLVDGRIPESPGCTTSELGEMMRQIGCYNATNWDGGRSAHLWLRGRGFMNKGCDNGKGERAISNGMFIFYRSEHEYNKELDSLLHADVTRVGGNYTGYDFTTERPATPAPKNYEAFYLSHYGRHGSRSRHNNQPYERLLQVLDSAKAVNNLTEKGEELYTFTQDLMRLYDNMPSRLTDKGEQEHTQLAERMYQRTPEIFAQKTGLIRAISSQKPRCLISMAAFTNQLARMNSNLKFDMDCGQQIQKIISPASDDEIAQCTRTRDSLVALLADDTLGVCRSLFLQPATYHLSPAQLTEAVYETVVTAQCFDRYANIYDFLPSCAIYRREMDMALRLWVPYGHNDLQTPMRREGVQVSLNDLIAKADAAICNLQSATCNLQPTCADLRFGHDTQMLSILAALEVSGLGEKMTPEELEYKWYTFRDLPMASNTQLIFYRPKKKAPATYTDDEILVKVLYNETERQLIGLQPINNVYYRWSDIKAKLTN